MAITLLVSLKHGGAAPVECWNRRIQAVQFSFLLKRGNNYFSFFQEMSQHKTTILTLLISLSILVFLQETERRNKAQEPKKEGQDSSQLKNTSEALAILLEDFFNCIFIYDQNLGFCVSYVLFGGSRAVWGSVCSSRFFTTIYLLRSCTATDTVSWTTISHLPSTQFCHRTKSLQILGVPEKQNNIPSSMTQSKRQAGWVIVTTVFPMNISKTKQQEKKILLKLNCVM